MTDSRTVTIFSSGLAASRPVTPSVGKGMLLFYLATDTTALSVWAGTAWHPVSTVATLVYPQVDMRFITDFVVKTGCGGSLIFSPDSAQTFEVFRYQTTPGNGDAISTSIYLEAGTYDVVVCSVTANNRGKLDWDIDGLSPFISGQDWYTSGLTYNVLKTGTLTVGADGRHVLTATVNGHNASAASPFYYLSPVYITLIKQTLTSS